MKLVGFASLIVILLSGCIFQQTVSKSVPNDLDIVYRFGACKAEWGQSQSEIFANGTMVRGNSTTQLTESETLHLLNEIEQSGFYSLNEYYTNTEVQEGSCKFISVTANNKTKTVSVSNVNEPAEFSKVVDAIASVESNQRD